MLDISAPSVTKGFASLFDQILLQCCSDMSVTPLHSLKHTRLFYGGNPKTRYEHLQKILSKFPFILDGILREYINYTLD